MPENEENREMVLKLLGNGTKFNSIKERVHKILAKPGNSLEGSKDPVIKELGLEKDPIKSQLVKEMFKRPEVLNLVQSVLKSPSNQVKLHDLMSSPNSTILNFGVPKIEATESLLKVCGL